MTLDRGHTKIDLLSSHFPKAVQQICTTIGNLIGSGICGIVAWRAFVQMGKFISRHKMSSVSGVGFPLWPFALILVIGFVLLALSCLWAIVREFAGYQRPNPNGPGAEGPEVEEEGGEA